MTRALRERVDSRDRVREPPYRSLMELRRRSRKCWRRSWAASRTTTVVLREMARKDRRFFAPLIMSILSAEFRGIDFFGRFTVEIQEDNVPWHMTMAFARQTFDESRHTQLNMKLLESLGSEVGEYPDIILGPQRR